MEEKIMACRILPIFFAFLLTTQSCLIQAMPIDVDGDGKVGPLELIDLSLNWKGPALAELWKVNGSVIYYNGGNVGIGTTIATSRLEIVAQDGLGIVGYQPFLTLKDDNAGYARSRIQGVNGNIHFYPNDFIGFFPPVSIFNGSGNMSVGTPNPDPRARLYAVTGESGGYAVKGDAPNGTGVYATTNSSYGGDAAVIGIGPNGENGAWAGLFVGHVHITKDLYLEGNIHSKHANFITTIDHPLDPDNKYLSHTSVESPKMKNLYDGIVVTDASGFATISLPDWFEALNKDFRYQLTVIGQFAQVIVDEKIHGNHFTIRTDKPNVEVSWQVTGVRQDAWAKTHPIEVEKAKSEEDRGKYPAPMEFGQPMKKGVYYRPDARLSSRPNSSTK